MAPLHLHAVFEMYRAFPANAQFNGAQRGPMPVPLFFGTGDGSPFAKLVPMIADGLRAHGCAHVRNGLDSWRRALCGRGSTGTGDRSD